QTLPRGRAIPSPARDRPGLLQPRPARTRHRQPRGALVGSECARRGGAGAVAPRATLPAAAAGIVRSARRSERADPVQSEVNAGGVNRLHNLRLSKIRALFTDTKVSLTFTNRTATILNSQKSGSRAIPRVRCMLTRRWRSRSPRRG